MRFIPALYFFGTALHLVSGFRLSDTCADAVVIVIYNHTFIGEVAELGLVAIGEPFLSEYKHAPYFLSHHKALSMKSSLCLSFWYS